MKFTLMVSMIMVSSSVFADVQTDKNAGICAAYLVVTKNPAAEMAINSADNVRRATQFGRQWMNELSRNKAGEFGYAVKADSACRNIGIRPGDYR